MEYYIPSAGMLVVISAFPCSLGWNVGSLTLCCVVFPQMADSVPSSLCVYDHASHVTSGT